MRKPIQDVTHTKNKILLSIYIFRALPLLYFETIAACNPQTKEKTRLIILNLIQSKVIKKSLADNGSVYIRLTKKGYIFVSTYLLPQKEQPLYTYRRDRGVNHKISDHDFYNFVFVWEFITKNPKMMNKYIQIYDDSNMNQCFVSFSHCGRKVLISPDILIFQPNEENPSFREAIFVENDGGGETYRRLFEKFVEYGLLLESGIKQNGIAKATIYFVFNSQKRAEQVLLSKKSIVQFFDHTNTTKKVKRVPIDTLLSAYSNHSIYVSTYNKHNLPTPLSFSEYPLVTLLLERRPEWKIYM